MFGAFDFIDPFVSHISQDRKERKERKERQDRRKDRREPKVPALKVPTQREITEALRGLRSAPRRTAWTPPQTELQTFLNRYNSVREAAYNQMNASPLRNYLKQYGVSVKTGPKLDRTLGCDIAVAARRFRRRVQRIHRSPMHDLAISGKFRYQLANTVLSRCQLKYRQVLSPMKNWISDNWCDIVLAKRKVDISPMRNFAIDYHDALRSAWVAYSYRYWVDHLHHEVSPLKADLTKACALRTEWAMWRQFMGQLIKAELAVGVYLVTSKLRKVLKYHLYDVWTRAYRRNMRFKDMLNSPLRHVATVELPQIIERYQNRQLKDHEIACGLAASPMRRACRNGLLRELNGELLIREERTDRAAIGSSCLAPCVLGHTVALLITKGAIGDLPDILESHMDASKGEYHYTVSLYSCASVVEVEEAIDHLLSIGGEGATVSVLVN